MKSLKKSGFTLMELLVYMGIVGIVVVIAGEAFSNSTKFRIRTDNMIKATQEAENVAMLLKDDAAQMGAKSSLDESVEAGNDIFNTSHIVDVYMDPQNPIVDNRDSSSFRLVYSNKAEMDSLVFRRIRYDTLGHYEAVEEVAWFLERTRSDTVLKRQCVIKDKKDNTIPDSPCAPKGSSGSSIGDSAVLMATGVHDFRVLPAIPRVRSNSDTLEYRSEQIFPLEGSNSFRFFSRQSEGDFVPLTTSAGGSSVTLSGFYSNYNSGEGKISDHNQWQKHQVVALLNDDKVGNTWAGLCSQAGNNFTFKPKEEYEISFKIPYSSTGADGNVNKMQMFVPGRDHMQVGFINLNGQRPAAIEDFMFYPPTSSNANNIERVMRFSVQDTVKRVCLAFSFAVFSPVVGNGSLTISDLKIKRGLHSNYHFDENVKNLPIQDKKNVKALKLLLSVKRGAKNGARGETGNVDLVIPVPSNGPRD
ncbi:type II secretion system protein [Fibrobacter sp.]|uniref:type II secretion system protein n=1 Tax=Fibrobacter sp. TaxID=35828 RepID=UPI00386956AF